MNRLDIIICIVLGFGLIRGLMKGLIREVLGILGAVLAVIFALHRFEAGGKLLASSFGLTPPVANTISFISICIGTVVAFYIMGLFLKKIAKTLGLRWVDIVGGGGLGAIKVGLIVSLILNALIMFPLSEAITREFNEAFLVPPLVMSAPGLYGLVIKVVPGARAFDYQKFLAEHTRLPLNSKLFKQKGRNQ